MSAASPRRWTVGLVAPLFLLGPLALCWGLGLAMERHWLEPVCRARCEALGQGLVGPHPGSKDGTRPSGCVCSGAEVVRWDGPERASRYQVLAFLGPYVIFGVGLRLTREVERFRRARRRRMRPPSDA